MVGKQDGGKCRETSALWKKSSVKDSVEREYRAKKGGRYETPSAPGTQAVLPQGFMIFCFGATAALNTQAFQDERMRGDAAGLRFGLWGLHGI